MKRRMSGSGWLVVGISALLTAAAGADGPRKPSIMAVMHKQYTVSNSPFVRIKKELNSGAPDWEKVRDSTRRYAILAEALQENGPVWGDEESWKRLTGLHAADAKAMDAAAEARDEEGLLAVHRRLAASCNGCHEAHRFRRRDGNPPGR